MGGSMTGLAVAVVGVLGTLLSGLLVQRGALRAKRVELEHAERERAERERAEERAERERAAEREARRASYVALNQRSRMYSRALVDWRNALHAAHQDGRDGAGGDGDGANGDGAGEVNELRRAAERARDELNVAYAEAQLAISDEVLAAAGRLVHLLFRVHRVLADEEPCREGETLELLFRRSSERIYEVRQVMRRDLGISELPVRRPPDHGQD
ncbi:hypothetical protein FH609_022010 [Streptomyces sp. 3MP-14]|uniref:Uncharacterized protein n=1 Tax=Streptomyces mimosae TaxID=2586635 RepID=A0A5N6A6A8_9ACTN|nr:MULTISPECIES: hypothetical protein [Streptomyces]KAB8163456.1 hypothetical protein FH607_019425 [Streptomyces mimosae]KAB8174733.1 hypothetical protein FH609_022010 [Streptomyces sp. 3MP-14]